MELHRLSLSEAADLISQRKLSPLELTRACLERIEHLEPLLNAFITLMAESALESAREAEQEIQRRGYRGPLHGIPLSLKDLYETAGVRTTHGSKFFIDYVPQSDAVVVQKLREAGAIILGKNNMHEIALGVTNVNAHFGACHNPWNLERITGGSSGGSAAALAAGLCLGSLGSDTGGSIRIPASLCGVVGLKPTYGRVSLRGVIPLSWHLDHAGPMARRVRDVAILLRYIAGYDPEDPASVNVPVDDYPAILEGDIRGWRVALAIDNHFNQSDPEVTAAVQAAAEVFQHLGAQVIPVDFPEGYQAALINGRMVTTDGAAFHRERLESRPQDFGKGVIERLQEGASRSAMEYSQMRREQSRLRRLYERFFEQYDVLLTPTTPVTAPPIEGPNAVEQARLLTRFTAPFNLTGLPAISLPCGFSSEGLPIGLQIASGPWAETKVLRAAYMYEQTTEWHQRWPAL